jgi:hypothetical protein
MPTADTGNWDLVIEVATSAMQRVLGRLLPGSLPSSNISNPAFSGTITPQIAPGAVSTAGGGQVTVAVAIDGTRINVENLTFAPPGVSNPPPAWLATIELRGEVQITDRLEMRGNDLVIDFAADAARSQPLVVVSLEEDSLLSAPLVQFALASAFLAGGEAAYLAARQQLIEGVENQIAQQVRAALAAVGRIVVVAAPSFPITGSALLTQSRSIHLCYSLCNPPGNTAAISRSMLLTTSAGTTADVAAVALTNASLLRCFVRPALAGRLGLPAGGFVGSHPCFFIGPTAISVPGLPGVITSVTINSLITGIDESGLLRVQATFTANGTAGAFTISGSADLAFRISASVSGGRLTIALASARAPIVNSDISIAWWVYVAGGLTGGFTVAAILALADVFGGALLNGPIASALAGVVGAVPSFTAPLPSGTPAVRVRSTSTVQGDSPRRTITAGPMSMPDPFRSHDVIVNFI